MQHLCMLTVRKQRRQCFHLLTHTPAIKDTGDFDAAVVTLKAASGAVATIINNRHCASGYDQRLETSGREGALLAENIRATTMRLSNTEVFTKSLSLL